MDAINGIAPFETELPPRMTLRVYTLNGAGSITTDTGPMPVQKGDVYSLGLAFPPCACPLCRTPGRQK